VQLRFGTQVAVIIADSNLSDRDAHDGGDKVRGLFSDNVFVFEERHAAVQRLSVPVIPDGI
jgi:hypothetical protein